MKTKQMRSLAWVGLLLTVLASTASAKSPNIVLITVDNFGYGELGVYGGGILRGGATPRIDKSLTHRSFKFEDRISLWCLVRTWKS